jgi:hypothetical protein
MKSDEENLGLDWLEKLVEQSKRESVFEGAAWNRLLVELGRITVYSMFLALTSRVY